MVRAGDVAADKEAVKTKGYLWWSSDPRQRRALAYGMTNFSAAVLNNIFITYYVEMAVSVTKVGEGWFMAAQVVYCIWNSLNDPACGWWADKHAISTGEGFLQRRVPRIARGGPLWALSFLLTWFPFGTSPESPTLAGLHLIAVLLLYDGWLSYTLINHQALLADMTADNEERERCNMYGAGCQVLGSVAVFAAHMSWNPGNLATFRYFAVAAAAAACFGFHCTASSRDITESCANLSESAGGASRCVADTPSFSTFVKQTRKHANLWAFSAMALLQQFACTFSTNFFSMFLILLVGRRLSAATQSMVLYASFILPHLGTMALTPVLRLVSKQRIVMALFVARLTVCLSGLYAIAGLLGVSAQAILGLQALHLDERAVAIVGAITGCEERSGVGDLSVNMQMITVSSDVALDEQKVSLVVTVLTLSLLMNRVLTENVCRLEPLLITDLIDEDCVLHKRRHLMSSMIFGSVSLMSKPGQSLAPVAGYYYLSRASHSQLQLWLCTLSLLYIVPLVLTTLSILSWTQYNLAGTYLTFVKKALTHELSHTNNPV